MWEVNLKTRTAKAGGFAVQFFAVPAGGTMGSDCFRDRDGAIWRGKVMPTSAYISNEALRMRMLYEAVDAFDKTMRRTANPFSQE